MHKQSKVQLGLTNAWEGHSVDYLGAIAESCEA